MKPLGQHSAAPVSCVFTRILYLKLNAISGKQLYIFIDQK